MNLASGILAMDNQEVRLIQSAQSGDRVAFTGLIRIYDTKIFNLCVYLTHNITEAKDVYQETFLQAFIKIRQLKEPVKFYFWLSRIAYNVWKQKVRTKKFKLFVNSLFKSNLTEEAPEEFTDPLSIWQNSENISIEQIEKVNLVRQILNQLPEPDKTLIVLRFTEQRSYREIAEILNCPVGTVKSRLARAIHKVKTIYKQK